MKMKEEKRQEREEGRELHIEEFIAFVKSHAFFSIIFIIYKYLKCIYKHANFLETTRYFRWVLFCISMYNMNKIIISMLPEIHFQNSFFHCPMKNNVSSGLS